MSTTYCCDCAKEVADLRQERDEAVDLLRKVFTRSEVNSNGRWLTFLTQDEWNKVGDFLAAVKEG